MSKHETEIQNAIIAAVEYFFTNPQFGFGIPLEDIIVRTPASGGQARRVDDFGRKPFDVAIYTPKTAALFLEVKERANSGRIKPFEADQQKMLITLAGNGVDIRYAYNGWDYDLAKRLKPDEVLKQTHVREAKDMTDPALVIPLPPAIILEHYLRNQTAGGAKTLVEVLDSNIQQLDSLNSMPLMILANMDSTESKVLIDLEPKKSLKLMKRLFDLPDTDRVNELSSLSSQKDGADLQLMAQAIFSMKDNWKISNKTKMKP